MGNRCGQETKNESANNSRGKKKANENNTPAMLNGLYQDTNERVSSPSGKYITINEWYSRQKWRVETLA